MRSACVILFLFFAACGQLAAASPDVPDFPVPRQGGKWGYVKDTATGKILLSPISYRVVAHSPDISIVPAPDEEGTWGYVDAVTGNVVIAPQFYEADFFYDGIAIVSRAYPDKAYAVRAQDHEGNISPAVLVPVAEGLIDRDGHEILPALYDLERANSNGAYIPRLYLLEDARGATAAFHADKGYIVPPGKYKHTRFTPEGGVFCDGVYYDPDGGRHTPPANSEVTSVEPGTGLLRVTRKKEDAASRKKEDAASLKGVMRLDGSLLVPMQYNDIKAAPAAGVWLASRVDASVERDLRAALLKGKMQDITEDTDVLTVDIYDAAGTVLRSFRARYFPTVSGEYCTYQSKGREYTVNARTWEAAPEQEAPPDPASGFQLFTESGKYGIKNADGAVSVKAIYDNLTSLGGGLFAATRNDVTYKNNWGAIDGTGREIIPFTYGRIEATSYPTDTTGPLLCMRYSPEKVWLLGRDGRFITPKNRPYTGSFYFNSVGLAVVSRDGKEGVIDSAGKEVLPCEYTTVFDELRLNEGKNRRETGRRKTAEEAAKTAGQTAKDALFRVERGTLWGLYDGTGKELIPVQYGFIYDLTDSEQEWFGVENEGRNKQGIVNIRTGQTIAPAYTGSVSVHPGFFLTYLHSSATDNKKDAHIMLDRQGKEIARYDRADWLAEAGVLAVQRDGKYALLDETGRQIYPFRCDTVWKAAASLVWCRTDGGKMLISNSGKEYRIQGRR